jgi:hypothetical protein
LQSASLTSLRRKRRKKRRTGLETLIKLQQAKRKNDIKKMTKALHASARNPLVALLKEAMETEMKSVGRLWSMLVFSSHQSTSLME